MSIDYLRALIQMVKAEGLPRFQLKTPEGEVSFEAPAGSVAASTSEEYAPDVLNDPYTFGGPSAGVPSFRRYE